MKRSVTIDLIDCLQTLLGPHMCKFYPLFAFTKNINALTNKLYTIDPASFFRRTNSRRTVYSSQDCISLIATGFVQQLWYGRIALGRLMQRRINEWPVSIGLQVAALYYVG